MDIIKKYQRVTVTRYGLFYERKDDPGLGYNFPCDENGDILEEEMQLEGRESLKECLQEKEKYLPPVIQVYVHSYNENAIGRCNCGNAVELYTDTNECGKCGRLYNLVGQSLAPYSQWKDEWNEIYY